MNNKRPLVPTNIVIYCILMVLSFCSNYHDPSTSDEWTGETAEITDADVWYDIIETVNLMLIKTDPSDTEAYLQMIKLLGDSIENRYHHWSLIACHQTSISMLFASMLHTFNGSQIDLVKIMKTMTRQNTERFGLGVDYYAWRVFLCRFYGLYNQHPDGFILVLLDEMEANDAGFSPDVLLYNKIMDGITRNPGIQSPDTALSLIFKRIRSNSSFHQFPHRVSINAVDVRQTVLLLRAHPNVILFDVDPNRLRQRFNDVYEALLAQSWMPAVMDLICVVMPRHNLHGVRSLHSSHPANGVLVGRNSSIR